MPDFIQWPNMDPGDHDIRGIGNWKRHSQFSSDETITGMTWTVDPATGLQTGASAYDATLDRVSVWLDPDSTSGDLTFLCTCRATTNKGRTINRTAEIHITKL